MRMPLAGLAFTAACAAGSGAGTPAPAPAATGSFDYLIGVSSESGDIISWIRPGHDALAVDRVVPIGIMPADIDGPHNVAMAPDQGSYYVSIAHGAPHGTLWRMDAGADTLLGRATLEFYPTTISLTPDGELAFVANSDFFGDRPRRNPVSVVHTPSMEKIADVTACDMPHGVRVNHAGTKVYITCMHSDELLEMDVSTFEIVRRARTGTAMPPGGEHAAHATDTAAASIAGSDACAPTFVSVAPDDRTLYVACNTGNTLQVWDAATLEQTREVAVGKGAYNVEASPDGRYVLVTNKKDRSVSLVDARSLEEIARIPTTKPVVHGIAWSPDGRYAYISQESVGADPGAVDMIDIAARRVVATVPLPAQPTGITIHRR
ncbi:MAG TPA: YncE family protein [Gemmatimonadales bacterium]|nr:YncE family protein [Gemmatimonadales bacterium]